MAERLVTGDKAPAFTLQDSTGRDVSLAPRPGRSTIVYFYPAASTPGCTKEACDFRDSLASLQAAGYDVLGISPDPVEKLAKFAANESLTFPLLSDADHAAAEAYGAWGEKKNYGKTYQGLIRSTVVVDPSGTVSLAQYNVRATGHVAKLRRDLNVDNYAIRRCLGWLPGPARAGTRGNATMDTGIRRRTFKVRSGTPRASGEIGRHAGFRFLCLRAWGFKSPLAHTGDPPASAGGSLR